MCFVIHVTYLEIALVCKEKGSGTGKGINDVYYLEIMHKAAR